MLDVLNLIRFAAHTGNVPLGFIQRNQRPNSSTISCLHAQSNVLNNFVWFFIFLSIK